MSDVIPDETQEEMAPGGLELIQALLNTRELDPDRESLEGPAELRDFLDEFAIAEGDEITGEDVERAREFREALRSLLYEREEGAVSAASAQRLRTASEGASLRMDVGDDGAVSVLPTCGGSDALIAEALGVIAAAQETGEWDRLKVCRSDECLWAFYDRSRNRSRHWCSMEVCGNRAKTRAYRAKRSDRA